MATQSGGNVNPQDSANKRITGMFEKRSDRGFYPALDGIERKTLAYGVRTLMRHLLTGGCLLCALGPAAEVDLVQIIQEQKTRHPITKTFLSGGSMGGTSVLIFTALHPELVDGVVSMNGTANMMELAGFEKPIVASYGGKKSERPDEYRKRSPELMAAKFGAIPIAFTAGGKDAVVPPQSVLRLSKELEKQNPGRVLMLYREEGGHTTSYEDAMAALNFVIKRPAD